MQYFSIWMALVAIAIALMAIADAIRKQTVVFGNAFSCECTKSEETAPEPDEVP